MLSEKLCENKCNTFHFYYFDLSYYLIHKNMSLNYVFGYVFFQRLKLK